jgi:hypothetical protein
MKIKLETPEGKEIFWIDVDTSSMEDYVLEELDIEVTHTGMQQLKEKLDKLVNDK